MNLDDSRIAIICSSTIGSSVFFLFLYIACKKCRRSNDNTRVQTTQLSTPRSLHSHSNCNIIKPDKTKSSFDCTICLDTIIEENPAIVILSVCKHKFHKECIDSFIASDQPLYNCPNCRTKICQFTEVNF
jgi:hypothetical protein